MINGSQLVPGNILQAIYFTVVIASSSAYSKTLLQCLWKCSFVYKFYFSLIFFCFPYSELTKHRETWGSLEKVGRFHGYSFYCSFKHVVLKLSAPKSSGGSVKNTNSQIQSPIQKVSNSRSGWRVSKDSNKSLDNVHDVGLMTTHGKLVC